MPINLCVSLFRHRHNRKNFDTASNSSHEPEFGQLHFAETAENVVCSEAVIQTLMKITRFREFWDRLWRHIYWIGLSFTTIQLFVILWLAWINFVSPKTRCFWFVCWFVFFSTIYQVWSWLKTNYFINQTDQKRFSQCNMILGFDFSKQTHTRKMVRCGTNCLSEVRIWLWVSSISSI